MLTLNLDQKNRWTCKQSVKFFDKKNGKYIPCRYYMEFYGIKYMELYGILISRKKAQFITREDCMKKFCSSIREHVANVINVERKNMLPSTKRDKITPKCDDMLHLWKKIHKKVC